MTETNNEPPAGQTWDPTLRQWTPSVGASAPELICHLDWSSSDTSGWRGTDNGLNNLAWIGAGPAQNNMVVLNEDFRPAYDPDYGDFGITVARRGIVRVEMSATLIKVSGTGDMTGKALTYVYGGTTGQGNGGVALVSRYPTEAVSSTAAACGSSFTQLVIDPDQQGMSANGRNAFIGASAIVPALNAPMYVNEFHCNVTFQAL